MSKSEYLQSLVEGRASNKAEVDALVSSKRAVSLTEDLKNDSILNPNQERRSTGSHRVCRCSQIKMLKDKTLEKIRLSIEAENLRLSTTADDKFNGQITLENRRYTKESAEPESRRSTKESTESVSRRSIKEPAAPENRRYTEEPIEPENRRHTEEAAETVNRRSTKESTASDSRRFTKEPRETESRTFTEEPAAPDGRLLTKESTESARRSNTKEPIIPENRRSTKESTAPDSRRSTKVSTETLSRKYTEEPPSPASRRSSKEQRYSEVFDNDVISGDCAMTDSKIESSIPTESARISSKLITETGMPYRISDFPPVRQSIQVSIPDDDIFEDIDKFHEKEQERIQAKKSSRESRYTEIFSNDICGCFEPDLIGDQEEEQKASRRSTVAYAENERQSAIRRSTDPMSIQEEELQRRVTRRSTKVQRYTEIFGNDMMGCILEIPDDNEEPVRDSYRSSKEQRYSEIYENDLFGVPVEFRESDEFLNRDQLKFVTPEPVIYVESEEDGNRFSIHHSSLETVEVPSKKSSIQIPNLDPSRSTRVTRYTEVFDNDMFGSVGLTEKATQTVSAQSSAATIPQTKYDHRRSTVNQRYTEIFDNDMIGGVQQQNEWQGTPSRQSVVTTVASVSKQTSATQHVLSETPSRQSSVSQQPSSIQQMHLLGTPSRQSFVSMQPSSTQQKYFTGTSCRPSTASISMQSSSVSQQYNLSETPSVSKQSIATDLQSSTSQELKYPKVPSNDLSGFIDDVTTIASEKVAQLAESSSKIEQQDAAPTRHSCSQKIKICSESCTSHLKPHQCSLEAPSCSPSCTTCKPFSDSFQRGSAQYEADDEHSSTLLHENAISKTSSIKSQQDQSSESPENTKRVCACSQNNPELFEKILSKKAV